MLIGWIALALGALEMSAAPKTTSHKVCWTLDHPVYSFTSAAISRSSVSSFSDVVGSSRLVPIHVFVSTELHLLGRRQITKISVSQFDHKRRLNWTALFELQADLTENFAGHRSDTDAANSKNLNRTGSSFQDTRPVSLSAEHR